MAGGVDLADQVRRSRTSIVLLIFSAAAIYYSTQIHLEHGFFWWNLGIAMVGVGFLLTAFYTLFRDWEHERDYRDLLRREKDAEVEKSEVELNEIREKQEREIGEEKEDPASIRAEKEKIPRDS